MISRIPTFGQLAVRLGSMLGLSLGLAVGALTSCEDPEPYECETDAQCNLDGEDGRCQDEGYCSYPDPECESGFRFHDDAPEDLAGTCVAVDEGT